MGRSQGKLWAEFERRGLLRIGEASRRLGVHHEVLLRYSQAGLIPSTTFEWNGHTRHGYRPKDLDALAAKMECTG